ncbi:hypothetical protein GCM10009547_49140 [Sporichthya brevicatena]|uniref:Peptidase M6 immune inhibitor A n=1 Tax=Sporichthya brevicatena TaxID=171442 RepID=A0ABN1HD99_9ACTN
MRVKTPRAVVAAAGVLGLLAAVTTGASTTARAADSPAESATRAGSAPDTLHLPEVTSLALSPQLQEMLGATTIDLDTLAKLRAARPSIPGEKTPPVGTTLLWPALDAAKGGPIGVYLKQYTLRAVGNHVEVWVASGQDGTSQGIRFPEGDCRNDVPGSVEITDAQLKSLVSEFDNNIYPKETAAFSTPRDRAGINTIPGLSAAGVNFAGDGDNTVTLVDNVRDPNFYEFPENRSYIAGFFMPLLNELTDRNIMTIDAFDWLHRTGANPKDEPDDDLCKSRPARPRSYEGTFAHEWQHLLHYYQDSLEHTWVNEGLSEFTETLVGYADATLTVDQAGSQGSLHCFQGWSIVKARGNPNPQACGGPQNSLTKWGDEGEGSEILADYGNAWSFMLFLYDRWGVEILAGLHRDKEAQGLTSVQRQLDQVASGTKVLDVLHDYQLMNLLDRFVDRKDGQVRGIAKERVTSKSLNATVNLENPASYAKPGAAPNGADYIVLRQGKDALPTSFGFTGAKMLPGAQESSSGDDPIALLDEILFGSPEEGAGTVANWHVSLVGIDAKKHRALVRSVDGFDVSFGAKDLAAFRSYPLLVAVVSHDDPVDTETNGDENAPYTYTVNGREQTG